MDNSSNGQKLKESKRKRLEFIDSRLFWEGKISRNDLTDFFDISVPQATNDIKQYTDIYPENISYDTKSRIHIVKETFKPSLVKPESDDYKNQLIIHSIENETPFYYGTFPKYDRLKNLERTLDVDNCRKIINALNNKKSIKIKYHSMDTGILERWVSPHAIGYDGHRLHMRAYCYAKYSFRDFNLGRIISVQDKTFDSSVDFNLDYLWETSFDVFIEPHPGLKEHQRECIEKEYKMENGQLIIPVKAAFLYYFFRKYGFCVKDYQNPEVIKPKMQQIVMMNKDEIEMKKELLEQMSIDKLKEKNYKIPEEFLQESK